MGHEGAPPLTLRTTPLASPQALAPASPCPCLTSGTRASFDHPPPRSAVGQVGMAGARVRRTAPAPLKDGGDTVPCQEPRTFPEVTEGRPARAEILEPSRRNPNAAPSLTNAGRGPRRLRRRTAQAGREEPKRGLEAEISEVVGRPRPLRTSAPKPLLPRKPASSRTRPPPLRSPPPPFTSSRILFTEGARERTGGAAQGARGRGRSGA